MSEKIRKKYVFPVTVLPNSKKTKRIPGWSCEHYKDKHANIVIEYKCQGSEKQCKAKTVSRKKLFNIRTNNEMSLKLKKKTNLSVIHEPAMVKLLLFFGGGRN